MSVYQFASGAAEAIGSEGGKYGDLAAAAQLMMNPNAQIEMGAKMALTTSRSVNDMIGSLAFSSSAALPESAQPTRAEGHNRSGGLAV